MSKKRVLCLDYEYGYAPAEYRSFGSTTSCLDYDVVIWDPKGVIGDYLLGGTTYQDLDCLSDDQSAKIQRDIARRRREFGEFLKLGRTLVVIVRAPIEYFYATGQKTYSGTGRNRATTRMVDKAQVMDALPLSLRLMSATGRSLALAIDGPMASFWTNQKDYLTYDAYFENTLGTTAFVVAGTQRAAGAVVRLDDGGTILLMPAPSFPVIELADEDEHSHEDEDSTPSAGPFFEDLLHLVEQLSSDSADVVLPSWSDRITLPGEGKRQSEVREKADAVVAAEADLDQAKNALRAVQHRKVLFSGTGRPLELAVRDVLQHLGGNVQEPEPGRDDWIVEFPEGIAVVEVKGVKNSAAEKHAAQLEKWVAGHFERTGSLAKGILVVNAWCETPLPDRTEAAFPSQMLTYSESRNHCLVTGVQLLGMSLDASNDRKRKAARTLLLESTGTVEAFSDWRTFLEVELTSDSGPGR